jgi:hypothetical protein
MGGRAALVGAAGCKRAIRWGTPEFNREVVRLRIADDCQRGIELMLEANARDDPRWYDQLVDFQLDCLAKTKQTHYEDEALNLVNEGIRRFPKSSRLVSLKGWVNGMMGEWGVQRRYEEDALRLANENIAADKDGRHSSDDRTVARNARHNLAADFPKPASTTIVAVFGVRTDQRTIGEFLDTVILLPNQHAGRVYRPGIDGYALVRIGKYDACAIKVLLKTVPDQLADLRARITRAPIVCKVIEGIPLDAIRSEGVACP